MAHIWPPRPSAKGASGLWRQRAHLVGGLWRAGAHDLHTQTGTAQAVQFLDPDVDTAGTGIGQAQDSQTLGKDLQQVDPGTTRNAVNRVEQIIISL